MNLEKLLGEPTHRRGWLLIKALECVPLDRALDLAREADLFVAGVDVVCAQVEVAQAPEIETEQPERLTPVEQPSLTPPPQPALPREQRAILTPAQRDELLARAANGATNAELAAQYGLMPRQVQGLRMGAARAASRRQTDRPQPQEREVSATVDEVVRYLRQRDDVVVPEGHGSFLVNGRFHLDLSDLVAKANRARSRQNLLPFNVAGVASAEGPHPVSNGHPIFWQTSDS